MRYVDAVPGESLDFKSWETTLPCVKMYNSGSKRATRITSFAWHSFCQAWQWHLYSINFVFLEKEKRKPSVSASWDPLGFLQIPKTLLVEQLISSGHQKGSPCFRKPKVLVEYRISVRNRVGIQRDHLCVCMMPKARVWVFPINLEDRTKEIKGLHKLVQSNG